MNVLVSRLLGSVARTSLAVVGGWLVNKGLVDADTANTVVGGIVGLGALLLSGKDKLDNTLTSSTSKPIKTITPEPSQAVTLSWQEYEDLRNKVRRYEQSTLIQPNPVQQPAKPKTEGYPQ